MRAMVVAFGLLMALPLLSAYVPTAEAATANVRVFNFGFDPSTTTIEQGDSVQWDWDSGGTPHSVVEGVPGAAGATWCSTSTSPNTCTKTFPAFGTYDYFCSVHPNSMRATVRVLAPPPTITIDSPADGASVSGTFTVSGTASSDAGITKVETRLDGGAWQSASGTTSWSLTIDTAFLSNGDKVLEARAIAGDGQVASQSINITIANPEVVDLWLTGVQGRTSFTANPLITIGLRNTGNVDLSSVVRLEYRYKGDWHLIKEVAVQLDAFEIKGYSTHWNSLTHVGRFDIRGTVDPDGLIAEDDETNNQRQHFAAFYTSGVNGKDLRDP